MEIKSKLFVFLIIFSILFTISAVSASEIQADALNIDNNYQTNTGINQDSYSDAISELYDEEINQDSESETTEVSNDSDFDLNTVNTNEDVFSENAGTFDDLHRNITNCEGTLNLENDYIHTSGDSYDSLNYYIGNSLIINGNGHIIDGANENSGFEFFKTKETSSVLTNLTMNNLTFKNFDGFALMFEKFNVTLNNVRFINCCDESAGTVWMCDYSELHFNNSAMLSGSSANAIMGTKCKISISNSNFSGDSCLDSCISLNRGQLIIENCSFENLSGKHGSIINFKGDYFSLKNSKFLNSNANLTGGAIIAKYFPISENITGEVVFVPSDAMVIENCVFSNLSSLSNGGAIYIDLDSGSQHIPQTLNIINSNFTDSKSKMGGGILILGGSLNIEGSNFINNSAKVEGGAIYSSWTNLNISNSAFENNNASRNGGALFFDKGKLTINGSSFIGNKALSESLTTANAIYAYDVDAYFANSTFDNGGVAVYADFARDSKIENVERNDDIFLMDNHNYIVSVESEGIKLNLTKNETVIDTLPSKFNLRDWGWVTPEKIQGDNDDCWAFATAASMESALLKSTGVAYNLSQNYIQELQLKYNQIGDKRISLTGFAYSGLGYALSWYGTLAIDGPYDDRGLAADQDFNVPRIHLQDALIIPGGSEDIATSIKKAIMKYGGVSVQIILDASHGEINDTGDDISITDHQIHFVTIIGWDDDYVDPSDSTRGIWITKDSLSGFDQIAYGDPRLLGIDYYAIVPQNPAIAYIFENDIDYHVNYQTDLTSLAGFDGNYTYYSNEFTSKYSELIGAVGTYFNESGINYSFDIFLNNAFVYSQSGVSEFAGFRTIVLNNYIPIKTGDKFKVVFKSNSVPYQAWSRVHYMNGTSLASKDNSSWTDFAPLNKTVCLKVYTVEEDENSFTALAKLINQSEGELNLTHDYRFNELLDSDSLEDIGGKLAISINKNKFVINGNNHVIDGAGIGAMFYFRDSSGELTINNLSFKNFNKTVITNEGKTTLNNINFTGTISKEMELIISFYSNLILDGCNFHSNEAKYNIAGQNSNITIINSNFSGNNNNCGCVFANRQQLIIHNSSFENFTSKNGAMIEYKGDRFELVNSRFINAYSTLSGGAILAKYFPRTGINTGSDNIAADPILIKDCIFTNLSCSNDGGVIHIDMDSAAEGIPKTMNIINSNFTNCSAKFGGAISLLGGNLNINESNFINNYASFEGGAIYSSWTNLSISKSNFANNNAAKNAGAIYFDKGGMVIDETNFTANKVLNPSSNSANAIYAHDVNATLSNSSFDNGGVAVYADFASDSKIENVEKNDDIFLMDNHNYIMSVENKGIKLNFTDNEIIVDSLPSKFDARDWGWTTPGKLQGDNDDCWAFATSASLETSLLKATGVAYNLSENYIQKLQLKYFKAGDKRNSLTGFIYSGLGYALSWYGVLSVDNYYDDRGMIEDTDMGVERIHVQDAMIIHTGMDDTIELLKKAILKYGAVSVQYYAEEPEEEIPTEGDDIAIMDHGTHFITLIGWDDDQQMAGGSKGIWITKDSLYGFSTTPFTNFGDIDYYAIAPQRAAIAYIFENDIDYHVNYQTDLTGLAGFDENYTYYSNEFTSKYSELIGAIGTYFNESGITYSFDIFVNNKKVHSQSGVSEFAGFRTIILNKYIPIKTGDKFKVVFKSNSVPYQAWSRVHYMNGTSLASKDGNSWTDFAPLNKTVCLKVYTVADDTKITGNKNIAVDYDGGSYFTAKVVTNDGRTVGAGESVKFTINGKTTTVKTDNNGVAKIKISQLPGKYTITTTYRGKTYKNTVTVKQILKATKASVKNTDKKLVLKANLKINGKAVKGKVIKFRLLGKTYTAKTNAKGIAQATIKQAVIKKFVKKSYPVKVSYLKDTVKTTITVKQVLKANKVTVKKSANNFKLKASLKINGKAAKKKLIKFTLLGKTYKAKTNAKGIAQVTIKKAVIKKLKKGKTYTAKVAYGKDYDKTTVKIK